VPLSQFRQVRFRLASRVGKFWRIDPLTGQAAEISSESFNPNQSPVRVPGSHAQISPPVAFRGSGSDPDVALYRIGSRDPGTRYTDFVIINGKRTDIYSGVNGDQMDFDPYSVWHDGPRLWFSNFDSKSLWRWMAATGLTSHSVEIPPGPSSATHPVVYQVAGPCA
jgi:hypothetical protein